MTDSNVASVITNCRQLDGIALAIELAAARCPLLGLQVISQRLDERFRLLRSGSRTAPSRQQTLQAAMDWSHALLSAEQQIAFRQLGVFVGGFTLELARRVMSQPGVDEWGNIDLLAELVERSLVSVAGGEAESGAPRYRLLETGRTYALQRLVDSAELAPARQRHASAMKELFEIAYEDCWVLPEADFVARYEPELDNLRAALDWAALHDPPTAIALTGASARLWRWLSPHPEALRRCAAACELIDATTPPAFAARLWEAIAQLSGEISSFESRPAAKKALALYEQVGDARGRYLALGHIAFSFRSATSEAVEAYAAMKKLEDPHWPPASKRVVRVAQIDNKLNQWSQYLQNLWASVNWYGYANDLHYKAQIDNWIQEWGKYGAWVKGQLQAELANLASIGGRIGDGHSAIIGLVARKN